MRATTVLLLVTVVLLTVVGAFACGDKLLHLTRIHRYQDRASHFTVLIFSRPSSLLENASSPKLQKTFEDEGIHVIYANGERELALAMHAGAADVVIADLADVTSVRQMSAGKPVVFIPVIAKGDRQNEPAAKAYPAMLKYPASPGKFLDAIERGLDSRTPKRTAALQPVNSSQ
jgi:hypothetical protein